MAKKRVLGLLGLRVSIIFGPGCGQGRIYDEVEVKAMGVLIVVVVSILAIGIGVVGLISPARQAAFVSLWESSTGLWASTGIRLVFGIALWFVAPATQIPVVLQELAVLAVVAAFVLPFLGLARFQAILAWWCRQPPAVIRAWSVAAVVFGSFILWSVLA